MLKEHFVTIVVKIPTDFESQEFEDYRKAFELMQKFIVKISPPEEGSLSEKVQTKL